jgi:pyruvate dehydrogenase E2 component (dihydrolipoamide acetyltransferase)
MIFEVGRCACCRAGTGSCSGCRCTGSCGAKDVNVPDIGGDEVEVTEVMVKVGDKVAAEQSLITVEGDKASWKCRRRSRVP